MKKRVLIADDFEISRYGIKMALSDLYGDFEFDEAKDGIEALQQVKHQQYDLILLDISMPNKNGFEVLLEIRRYYKQLPVLMVSGYPEEQHGIRALKGGANGFLMKGSPIKELYRAVNLLLQGRKYISPQLAEIVALYFNDDSSMPSYENLSHREFEVLMFIVSGRSTSQIADELHLSEKTISTYRSRILQKLQLQNNVELTRYAIENELIRPAVSLN